MTPVAIGTGHRHHALCVKADGHCICKALEAHDVEVRADERKRIALAEARAADKELQVENEAYIAAMSTM
jgi:hypothetical protein